MFLPPYEAVQKFPPSPLTKGIRVKTKKNPKLETLDMNMTVQTTDGITIPCAVSVTYPKGQGFYAVKALQSPNENMSGVWQELVHRKDASTLKMMQNSGHAGGDD